MNNAAGRVWARTRILHALSLLAVLLLAPASASGDSNEACFECHGEEGFERDEPARPGDLYVDPAVYRSSIHGRKDCTFCHEDAELEDGEHEPDLEEISCGDCHDDDAEIYAGSLHGRAVARGDTLAPKCQNCHTTHAVLPPTDPRSSTYKLNIPATCSRCHREGTAVTTAHEFGQHEVFEHYSMSIHGVGLFRRGLIVTAVCVDCHGAHDILEHEDPRSSIHRDRVAKTCMKCHAEIERVHKKVIRGELWEKQPHLIPACVDCHRPHEVRRVVYEEAFTDTDCLRCHGPDAAPAPLVPGGPPLRAPRMDPERLASSAHTRLACVKCHSHVSHIDQPPCRHAGKVDCTACHAEQGEVFETSVHKRYRDQGIDEAPTCSTCHGTHEVAPRNRKDSPIHPRNIPRLCGRCHGAGGAAVLAGGGAHGTEVAYYYESIHGRGLQESGLVVSAVCTSCHTAHGELPPSDPRSTVHPDNLAETCGACHMSIAETLAESVHGATAAKSGRRAPSCEDCHSAHRIVRTRDEDFRQRILAQCGTCHEEVTESYFNTYHGKVSRLGSANAAKCSDCHGSHDIRPPSDPRSRLSHDNIVRTCGACHPGSHRRFAGYLTHATHHDPNKYPALFYTFWFMTFLLAGTLCFFGLHTLLWLPRSIRELLRHRELRRENPDERWLRRFPTYHRVTHIVVIVSFLTLVLTGMTLKFSYAAWAQAVADFVGGFRVAGSLHRLAAVATFGYFAMHLLYILRERTRQGATWRHFLFGPDSLWPNRRDMREFGQTLKWFVGLGPRPNYGRWTYWEKFDYLAVFWGVAVIGLSGLVLWFPEAFTRVLPGWAINVATIIHSDEALLAAGFIFTVHFFNTHFRPENFPMDPVIFTGAVRVDEFREERPREYERLAASGELDEMLVPPPSPGAVRAAHVFGLLALCLGLLFVGLIAYSMIFAYR